MANVQPIRAGLKPFPGYCLSRLIGRGGYSEVWQADVEGGAPVALKFMPCDSGTAAALEIRNIQKVRQVEHPNLLRIDRIWCHENHIVIAMELADADLDGLYQAHRTEFRTPIAPTQVCVHLTQAAAAIDFLNARQHRIDGRLVSIQHCDIKPGNLLLFGDTVKVSDFGLAMTTAAAKQSFRTQGTPAYAAPEIFQGQVSSHSDQYALAVTYCGLRSGCLPFPDVGDFRKSWPRRRPRADLSMLTPPERPVIDRALSMVPTQRWPSCQEMMAKLTQVFA
jgi:serine/threonine protein kinase